MDFKRLSVIWTLLVLTIYVLTLNPTIAPGDAGELITMAYAGGVLHPPGYPLYSLLAKIFTFIPFGSVAFRVNLLSAVLSAAASGLLFLFMSNWTKKSWIGLLSASLFSFSPLVWKYSVTAEVFSLNHLLIMTVFFFASRFENTKNPKDALWCNLFFGLCLSNHYTSVFLTLPIFLWTCSRCNFNWKIMLVPILGLTPYLYLLIAKQTTHSWGDTRTFAGFLTHILRTEYGVFQLGPNIIENTFFDSLVYFFKQMFTEMLGLGILLSIVGVLISFKRKISLLQFMFAGLLFYIFIFHLLARFTVQDEVYREVLSRFWQQPVLLLSVFAGFGAFYINDFLNHIKLNLFAGFGIILAMTQLGLNFKSSDQSKDTLFYEFGKNLIERIPSGSVYLPFGDLDFFTTLYLQKCEGLRPDLIILSQGRLSRSWYINRIRLEYPRLHFSEYPFSLIEFFNQNINNLPIFISSRQPGLAIWESDYEAVPIGFSDQIIKKTQIPLISDLQKNIDWGPFPNILLLPTNFTAWQSHLSKRYTASKNLHTYFLKKTLLTNKYEDHQ